MSDPQQPLKSKSSMDISDFNFTSARSKRKYTTYFKLIDLYKQHECLWMENSKDFFNFALKESVWEQIANQMISQANPNPDPGKWKRIIHRLRYKVQLEELREQEAKYCNALDGLPPKLCYSSKFQFLFKHMFDRKTLLPLKSTPNVEEDAAPDVPPESLAAKCMRLGRNRIKSHTSFILKLQALENLRNRRRSTLTLTPEAFNKLKNVDKKVVDSRLKWKQ